MAYQSINLVTGRQLRAARILAGMTQRDLATVQERRCLQSIDITDFLRMHPHLPPVVLDWQNKLEAARVDDPAYARVLAKELRSLVCESAVDPIYILRGTVSPEVPALVDFRRIVAEVARPSPVLPVCHGKATSTAPSMLMAYPLTLGVHGG